MVPSSRGYLMKLVAFQRAGQHGVGALIDGGLVDLAAVPGAKGVVDVLSDAAMMTAARNLIAIKASTGDVDFADGDFTLTIPVPRPSKVICVGINYAAHAEEAGRKVGKYPVIFHRFAQSLVGPGEPLVRPIVSDEFDYEGELAVIIGQGGSHIDVADAMNHVGGYTLFNDASVRDWQFHTHQYGMGKNFRGTGALGPYVLTADEVPDYRRMALRTHINGDELQYGELHELAFDIPHLIAYVSQALDWLPGDILATGTPSGIGFKRKPPIFLKPGDTVEVSIHELGVLSNPVVAER